MDDVISLQLLLQRAPRSIFALRGWCLIVHLNLLPVFGGRIFNGRSLYYTRDKKAIM